MKFLDSNGLSHLVAWIKGAFVAQVSGKGLSTNDYTTTEKNKLDGIATNANAYTLPTANGSTRGGVTLSDSTSSTSGTSGGIAATPNAVKSALDSAKSYVDGKGYVTQSALTAANYATQTQLSGKLDSSKVKIVTTAPTSTSTASDPDGTIYFVVS